VLAVHFEASISSALFLADPLPATRRQIDVNVTKESLTNSDALARQRMSDPP